MGAVMVTGGAGMVGGALVDHLVVNSGRDVIVIDDLSRGKRQFVNPRARFLMEDVSLGIPYTPGTVELVFHCAARVGGVQFTQRDQWQNFANAAFDWKVLDYCVDRRIPLLYVSSACVYPTSLQENIIEPIPMRETDAYNNVGPDSIYGWTKLLGELAVESAVRERGLDAKIVRLFNVYGPRGLPEPTTGHVIPALIYKCLRTQGDLVVWGSGKQRRSFVHVFDVVDGIMQVVNHGKPGEVYNIGTPETVTIGELAVSIMNAVGPDGRQIQFDTLQPEGVFGRCANIDKIKELGWSPRISLQSGLWNTVEWCRSYLEGRFAN